MTEILWIDNDCNGEYKDFVDVIEDHGYKATAVETVPEGIELLKKDMNRFSAIITDARGKMVQSGSETLSSLKEFEQELMRLWNKRYIPYYIYTGKQAVYESETFREEHKEFFRKGLEDEKLFVKIEKDLGQLPEIQIEYMYKDVIDAARKVIGKKKTAKLIKLLKGIHFLDSRPEEPPKNALRSIMCACLKTFIKYGLVPEECLRSGSNLPIYDDVREYLSGQRAVHTFGGTTIGGVMDAEGPVFGEVMAQHLEDIMNYVNAGSHEEGDDDEDDDENDETLVQVDVEVNERYESYDADIKDNLLFYSYLLQICDLIRYSADYITYHNNVDVNRGRVVRLYDIFKDYAGNAEAIVELDDNGVPHCGPCEIGPVGSNQSLPNSGDWIQLFRKNNAFDSIVINKNGSEHPFYIKNCRIFPKREIVNRFGQNTLWVYRNDDSSAVPHLHYEGSEITYAEQEVLLDNGETSIERRRISEEFEVEIAIRDSSICSSPTGHNWESIPIAKADFDQWICRSYKLVKDAWNRNNKSNTIR